MHPAVRQPGAGDPAVRGPGRGPPARRALADPGHGQQPGPERLCRPAGALAAGGLRRAGRRRASLALAGVLRRPGPRLAPVVRRLAARPRRRTAAIVRSAPVWVAVVRPVRGTAAGATVIGPAVIGAVARLPAVSAARRLAAGRRGRGVEGIGQGLVESLLVEPGDVERIPAAAVRQREPRGLADIVGTDLVAVVPGGQRDGRPGHHEVGAQAVHLERRANRADLLQDAIGQPHRRQPLARGDHSPGNPF